MRRFHPAILCCFVLLLLNTVAWAKDAKNIATEIAPLVNDSTLLVAHVDLSAVDLPKICDAAANGLEGPLADCGFDKSSVRGINREAKKLILQGKTKIVDIVSTLTKKTGVSDVYAVMQIDVPKKGSPNEPIIYLAFPIGNRNAAQRKELADLFAPAVEAQAVWLPFEFKEFQLVVLRDESAKKHASMEEIERYFETQKPSATPIPVEAFARCEKATLNGAFRIPPVLFDTFRESPIDDAGFKELPSRDKIIAMIERWKEHITKIQWAAFGVDLDTMESVGVIRAVDAAAAAEIRSLAEESIYLVGDVIREGIQKDADSAFIGPFISELFKGAYRAYLPVTTKNELVSKYEFQRWGNVVLGFYIGLANFIPDVDKDE